MLHILCLNWNGNHLLSKMVPSLIKNLSNIPNQILIRDNGSQDKSIEYLSQFKEINIIPIKHNRDSFSEGMNFLFKQAASKPDDTILFLNNDIEFKDSISLSNMIQCMTNLKAGIVGARLMYENDTISHNGVIFSHKYGDMPWHFREWEIPDRYDLKNKKFQAVTAACMMMKAGLFEQVGMFDTNFKWSFEDVDLNLKVSVGLRLPVVCCGSTNIVHLTSHSLNKNPVNKLFMKQNVINFKKKWFGKYAIDHDFYLKDRKYNLV